MYKRTYIRRNYTWIFFKIFKKRNDKKLLVNGLNRDVIEGFIDKIEDIVCIADINYKIDYINKPNLASEYSYLLELLEYDENKELYNKIVNTAKEEGFYSNNIEIVKNKEKHAMYIAIYYVQSVEKYIVYIKDTNKYLQKETILKERLSESNEALRNKELFVANLSHEIKTPINIIVAMVYFLKSTKMDENQIEYVNRLESASDLLIELVNNILNVTKSEKITNAVDTKEKFILKDLLDKVYTIFKNEIEEKNIQWSIKSNMDLDVEIYESKTRLEQIFINLISNAVKYTEKGYIEVEATKLSENINTYDIRFCIKDTGIGIKREDTIKIFKEFEQTTDPTIKEKEGFGLGLPLVKKIIESMGGKIWVESSYGLGTKFFFELSISKDSNNPLNKEIQKDNNLVEEEFHNVSNKILIVDDNKVINEITEKILKEIDVECDIAEDGMSAIRLVEEKGINYYSVILMDIHMPKYNGYDISRIMKNELGVKTPIVALTATNITDDIVEDNKDFISSYIQKPVKPEELKRIIKSMVCNSTRAKNISKRETIIFMADKIKNWEIVEELNNTYNVICTLNKKDISIILETKKVSALLIDKTENVVDMNFLSDFTKVLQLFVNYEIIEGKQQNISVSTKEGFIKNIENISDTSYILKDIIGRYNKENNIDDTIQEYNNEISEIYKFLYDSLVNLTSVRSKETGAHLMRTQEYIKVMLREYERSFKTGEFDSIKKIENIGIAATLHDIGKVGISDEILNKPGKLTEEEYNKIKEHVIIGYQILESTSSENISNDTLEYAKEITLHHHEKYDGTGYPDGLKCEEINIISRIMAIIDVYDALVNDRVYKKAMDYKQAEEYIISESGKSFDPKIVNIFVNVKSELRKINEKYRE